MNGEDLILELSSSNRTKILQLLSDSELKASEIAKQQDTSIQAITRHVDRLHDTGLIEKNDNGRYRLTTIGRVLLLQYPFFEFISRYKDYFETHDFFGIPDHLLVRLGDLVNCEFESNPMKGFQRCRDWAVEMKKYVKAVSYTTPMEYFDAVSESMKNGATQQMVFGTNSVFPKGFSEYMKKSWNTYIKSGQAQVKVVKDVPLVVAVKENEAMLVFANKNTGYPDSGVFFSKDPKFIKWCLDLFEYYWNLPQIENYTLVEQ